MKNKVGLNITDDEYVRLKLEQREQKRILSRKPHVPVDTMIESSLNKTNKTHRQNTTITSKDANKEKEIPHEPHIVVALQQLQDMIQFIQSKFYNDLSDEENVFALSGD